MWPPFVLDIVANCFRLLPFHLNWPFVRCKQRQSGRRFKKSERFENGYDTVLSNF